MTAKILTIANQKGGSGKTNLAMSLAGVFGRRGFTTVVVDGDTQGTATSWYASAPDDAPFPALVTNLAPAGKNFARAVRELISGYEVIIIDTPPNLTDPVLLQALALADLALVPMIPAPGDLWAAQPLMNVIAQTRATNPDLVLRVVPSMVQSTTSAADNLALLPELGLDITASGLTQRVAFRQAIGLGITVLDLKDEKAKAEINAIADEALTLMMLPITGRASTKKLA